MLLFEGEYNYEITKIKIPINSSNHCPRLRSVLRSIHDRSHMPVRYVVVQYEYGDYPERHFHLIQVIPLERKTKKLYLINIIEYYTYQQDTR